ncbi:MAG: SDR family oxidoreductase [Pseudomonadota bacterium]
MATVVITGANRGIGLALTKTYAARGDTVHAACRAPDEASELREVGGNVQLHAVDVGHHASIDSLAQAITEPVDVVIANAGVYGLSGADQTFADLDFKGVDFTFNINTIGALKTLQAFIPHVSKSDGKKLVAITSKMGSIDDASSGMIAYRSSKTALNMALCCAANELQDKGIAVGTLHPGWVRTRMGGDNAPTTTQESADGLASVIDSLTPGPKAAFKDFRGDAIAW